MVNAHTSQIWKDLFFAVNFCERDARTIQLTHSGSPQNYNTYICYYVPAYMHTYILYNAYTELFTNCYNVLCSFMVALELIMPMVMTLAWLFSIAMNVHFIVKEKQLRLKEFMKMMGLSNGVHWTAWFITQLIVISISIVAIVPLLKFGGLYPRSNPLLIWLYLELYAVSLIFYG